MDQLSRAEAWEIVGGLSNPSKMPCYAWGIPAQACKVGGKLAEVEGSICHGCYALKGFYRMSNVRRAYQRRLDRFGHPRWVEAMVRLVRWQGLETGLAFFRWFDSGDLQSVRMLQTIAEVADQTPEIRHWLPTREYAVVRQYLARETPPDNLVIRISAPMVDGEPPKLGLPTSTVHQGERAEGFTCPAYSQKPARCGYCRACWDGDVENVSYPFH